jgi:hypothetical protein
MDETFTMNLNKPPRKPLISALHIKDLTKGKWGNALDRAMLSEKSGDRNYEGIRALIPTGHVSPIQNDGFFHFSEEIVHSILTEPEFFRAWRKISGL